MKLKRSLAAQQIRDAALAMCRELGKLDQQGALELRFANVQVLYSSQFSKIVRLAKAQAARAGFPDTEEDNWLDIWADNKKALGLRWNEGGPLYIIGFKRGDWKSTLPFQ